MKRQVGKATGHLSRTQLLVILGLLALIGATAGAILIQRNPEPQPPIVPPRQEQVVPGTARQAPEQTLRALPPREQLARAFAAAFGRREAARVPVTGENADGGEQVEFRPGILLWTDFGPALVSEGEVIDAAHVSSGKIAIHYLQPAADTFQVARSFVPAVETGSFGRVGSWRISDAFSSHPVLYAEGGGTWQGHSCSYATLTELTPGGIVELARFPTHYSDAGAVVTGKPTEIDAEVTNIVRGKSFDVAYSGSRSWTTHYERRGGSYVAAGEPPQLREC